MIHIENPSKKEYESIMQFLEESFDHSRGFFYHTFPQVMSKDTLDYENIFIIRENKKIASLICIFPQTIVLNGRKTTIGGIGSVSTHPDFRSKGYMKILMDFCIEEMKRRNYSFSILGGDRQRYNFWGYETCGTGASITITQRSCEKSGMIETVPTFRYDGSIEILEKIKQVHEKFPCYVERTIHWLKKIFDERIHTQLYFTKTKTGFAYVVAVGERTERKIVEIGGDNKLWCPLIYSLLKRWNTNGVEVLFPANIPETNVLIKHASWFIIHPFCMIKILSFKETITFLFGQDFQTNYLLKVSETKEVFGSGDRLIEFDEKKWVRILFGPFQSETPDFMKKFLPSQFYWWFLDHI
ncbi:MAG: GNAT family N-acetyltransferase [Candidatus Omnitrophica bacterium]|nr:GNAT family N-acetyltransferase [Candidatus Omnitrophota bacterium]MCM8817525.1 GNAT family N-acetyltransferase [Candidatus Omnitrophota bacterium]